MAFVRTRGAFFGRGTALTSLAQLYGRLTLRVGVLGLMSMPTTSMSESSLSSSSVCTSACVCTVLLARESTMV